jgi:hypothetical protein
MAKLGCRWRTPQAWRHKRQPQPTMPDRMCLSNCVTHATLRSPRSRQRRPHATPRCIVIPRRIAARPPPKIREDPGLDAINILAIQGVVGLVTRGRGPEAKASLACKIRAPLRRDHTGIRLTGHRGFPMRDRFLTRPRHAGSSAVLISTRVASARCTGHLSAISSRRARCSALSGPISRSDRSTRSIKVFLSSQSAQSRL